jgi:hypothetical protein
MMSPTTRRTRGGPAGPRGGALRAAPRVRVGVLDPSSRQDLELMVILGAAVLAVLAEAVLRAA